MSPLTRSSPAWVTRIEKKKDEIKATHNPRVGRI